MARSWPEWERYERLIARMLADQVGTDLCVTPNAFIMGSVSGIRRQIDVVLDARHDTDNSRRLIVDAKKRTRKIDVTDVEAFLGVVDDVNATHGYLVCTAGYTKAAEQRAQSTVSIRIVPLDRLDDFDPSTWPRCKNGDCRDGRVFWDGYPELTLKVQPLGSPSMQRVSLTRFVHYVGKCDRCGRFHVRCLTCADLLSVPEGDDSDIGHRCRCEPPWFWLASIEQDASGRESAELHACFVTGGFETVDRRPL